MKNKLFILLLIVFALSCKKEEYVFDQSPDQRLNEALTKYQAALTSSPTGWKATVEPRAGGVYHYYFQFNSENRVFMFSDFDTTTARIRGESSYRLKALQQPSLIFDTYSYLHLLADPDAAVNGGSYGEGLSSDFEFTFENASEDSIVLTGRVNRTKLKLEKGTQADLDAWQNGVWLSILSFLNIQKIEHYFRRLTLGGNTYEIAVDPVGRIIRFQWVSGGILQTFTTGFSFSSNGVVLDSPLVNGSQTIETLSDFSWNQVAQTLQLSSGGLNGSITGAAAPLRVDLQAPQRWWQQAVTADSYWFSPQGFSTTGATDLFDIRSLDRYYYFIYWPGFSVDSDDLFAPIFLNETNDGLELQYGAAPEPGFTGDGKVIFDYLGMYGSYPSSGPALQSLQQLLIPEGYYLVQTGAATYDMVSAKDAKTWISWRLAQ
ncbi:MAG: DUF4302 domain-containing protein [Chitinophagaceae bacterium]|nr:DUF4302 domain-containing protein [Chitinophagaceae bacterium]MCW5926181.1 DUF4302 domain-containing protein [Chitinophagaceae bacterium]